jgi:protein TonB
MVSEPIPRFRGGSNQELVAYVQERIVWPEVNGKMIKAEGRLFVSFTVGTDGRAHDARVVKTFDPRFNEAVLQVVRQLTGFTPGQQQGKPVAINFTLPITFKIK